MAAEVFGEQACTLLYIMAKQEAQKMSDVKNRCRGYCCDVEYIPPQLSFTHRLCITVVSYAAPNIHVHHNAKKEC